MSHKLIEANADLRRLREDGYNIDIHGACLVIRDIPYVTGNRKVKYDGALVTSLDLNGELTNRPGDHQIRFAGDCPCKSDGTPIDGLRLSNENIRVSEKLTVNWHFSSKPPRGHYVDYHEKVRTYAAILAGHATSLDPDATPRTKRVVEPEDDNSPFCYLDTASARAEINMVTAKLVMDRVAVIGVGGTGSYVLDLLAKTPVKEIHLFDGDKFSSHNAFRAPGAASKEQLREQPLKVDYFKSIYSRLHKGINAHPHHIDDSNVEELRGMAFVFLCIDASKGKKYVVDKLEGFGLPFIDVGMGLYVTNETIGGILRVTTSTLETRARARARMSFADEDGANEYDKNIQIADLNALNATLAVVRWKKMCGFYFDKKREHYNSYTIGSSMLLNEDINESAS